MRFLDKNNILIVFYFLLLIILIIWLNPNHMGSDQGRYMMFAENITHGFYTNSDQNYNLWSGPGYPLFLAIFKIWELPLIVFRLLNAVFLTFSLLMVNKILRAEKIKNYFQICLLFAIITLYFILDKISFILTEPFTYAIISAIVYLGYRFEYYKSIKIGYCLSFCLSLLVLTKIAFGYVIFVCSIVVFIFNRFKNYRNIFMHSLILLVPYLSYTYYISGKPLFFGNSGAMSLYTMTTLSKDFSGQWKNPKTLRTIDEHKHLMLKIDSSQSSNERYELYMQAALKNITNKPLKYLSNIRANFGRLFLGYPWDNSQ